MADSFIHRHPTTSYDNGYRAQESPAPRVEYLDAASRLQAARQDDNALRALIDNNRCSDTTRDNGTPDECSAAGVQHADAPGLTGTCGHKNPPAAGVQRRRPTPWNGGGLRFESGRGLCKSAAGRLFFVQIDLLLVERAIGMEPWMEP